MSLINDVTQNKTKYGIAKLQDDDIFGMPWKEDTCRTGKTLLDLLVEDMWMALKGSVNQACDQFLTSVKHQQRKKLWMTLRDDG